MVFYLIKYIAEITGKTDDVIDMTQYDMLGTFIVVLNGFAK